MNTGKDTITFAVRRLVCQSALDHALAVDPERIDLEVLDNLIRAVFHIATLQDEVFDYPENFLTRWGWRWQTLKAEKFPRWLRRRCPNVTNRVWAIHKFPELNLPREFESAEFVHFRVIKETPGNE